MKPAKSPWLPQADRQRHQELKREAVLQAAARAFGRRGYQATRIDDIAEELNVTKPTVYYYFKTKEALMLACIERAMEELAEAMESVPTEATPRDRVAAFLKEYLQLMTGDVGRCLANTSEHDLKPKAAKQLLNAKRKVDDMLHALVEQGMACGELEKRDPVVTTFTLFGAMNGVARWYKPGGRVNASRLPDTISDLLMEGLRKREAA